MRSSEVVLLALLAAGCAKTPAALPSAPPLDPLTQLTQDLTAVTNRPGVQRAAWGIVIESLDRRVRLFELNPRTLLVPASTLKLVSLAAAVDSVGWEYRYRTAIQASAPIVDGTITGDVLIRGSGDPSIGGRGGQPLAVIVDRLKALGIRRIDGRIIGDDNAIEDPRPQLAWAWDDLGYPTGALFGALNLGENRMDVTVNPAAMPGDRPVLSVQPEAWTRPLRNNIITAAAGSGQLLYPEQLPGEPFLRLSGSIPAGAIPARMQVAVGNPTFWFAAVLKQALIASGIDVTGDSYDIDDVAERPEWKTATSLYTYESPTLADITQPMLKESINLYGEAMLRLNAGARAVPATNDAALEGLRMRLDSWGIPRDSWQIVDGSGLSRRDAVAPEVFVTILVRMYEDPSALSPWMMGLPIAGRDGTLAARMKGTPAENNARAKTGTMSNIRALAGYVRTRDGEMLAFAIMEDNFEGSGANATDAIDAIVARLAGFTRTP